MRTSARGACSLAALLTLIAIFPAQSQDRKKAERPAPAEKIAGGNSATLVVYHKCNLFSALSGGVFGGAAGHLHVADKNLGPTPVCSVRSFQVPVGEHAIVIKDWTGIHLGLANRTARFAAGQTVHIAVGKASNSYAFIWEPISPTQAAELAREIKSVSK